MMVEQLPLFIDASVQGAELSKTSPAVSPSGRAGMRKTVRAMQRETARPEAFEQLLRGLRGGTLILAVLSYDLGLRISHLKRLRIRDVSLARRAILVNGRERNLPPIILDDLREYLHERLCGSDASVAAGRLDQPLFPHDVVEETFKRCLSAFVVGGASERVRAAASVLSGITSHGLSSEIAGDALLRMSGRWHKRNALRLGIKISSPLELFDKGPRIVRRRNAGAVDAYYLWRTTAAYWRG